MKLANTAPPKPFFFTVPLKKGFPVTLLRVQWTVLLIDAQQLIYAAVTGKKSIYKQSF